MSYCPIIPIAPNLIKVQENRHIYLVSLVLVLAPRRELESALEVGLSDWSSMLRWSFVSLPALDLEEPAD